MSRRHPVALAGACALASVVLAGEPARADDRVLFLREEGVDAAPPSGTVAPAEVPTPGDTSVATAEAALARARELFLASSFSDAAAGLHQAGEATAGDLQRASRDLAIALEVWTGACERLAGSTDGSRAAFRRALALDPHAALPAGTFPPAVEGFFRDVVSEVQRQGTGSTTIASVPAGARVEVDGRPVGATPVTVHLPPGEHALRLERTGYERYTDMLDMEGRGLRETPPVVLQRATGNDLRAQVGRPGGLLDLPDAPTLAALAREYDADRVVVARRDGAALRYPEEAARSSAVVWPWIAGGAALAAVTVGTVLFFALRPAPEVRFRTGF